MIYLPFMKDNFWTLINGFLSNTGGLKNVPVSSLRVICAKICTGCGNCICRKYMSCCFYTLRFSLVLHERVLLEFYLFQENFKVF